MEISRSCFLLVATSNLSKMIKMISEVNKINLFKELIVHKSCSSLHVKWSLFDKCVQACNCVSFWKHPKQVSYQEVTSFMLYTISILQLISIQRKALSKEKRENEDLHFVVISENRKPKATLKASFWFWWHPH